MPGVQGSFQESFGTTIPVMNVNGKLQPNPRKMTKSTEVLLAPSGEDLRPTEVLPEGEGNTDW